MKRQLLNTIYGLKFEMEKNDFERLKSSNRKKRNKFVANPIHKCARLVRMSKKSMLIIKYVGISYNILAKLFLII